MPAFGFLEAGGMVAEAHTASGDDERRPRVQAETDLCSALKKGLDPLREFHRMLGLAAPSATRPVDPGSCAYLLGFPKPARRSDHPRIGGRHRKRRVRY
ncbi:MAG: hypothetical protein CSA62_07165 [Planctomycetota bacterium]|nr:MAG: hypothetical protein CSA62_07165 [Planctomycetota bacterium]